MNMKCEVVRDLIPMYIDGTASVETAAEIDAHLKECEDCRKFYNMCRKNERVSFGGAGHKIMEKIKGSGCDIGELDKQYAILSKKLKKRKLRQTLIGIALLSGMLTYVAFDIAKAINKRNKGEK